MNEPPESWRWAVFWLHFGHVSSASSVMRWTASQAFPQDLQAYS
jgi:hypothetical protein